MITAIVFDLDGTLVQTERLKALSYARAAQRLRPEIETEQVLEAFKVVVGRARQEVAQHLLREFDLSAEASQRTHEYGVQRPWQAYVQIRLEIYTEMIATDSVIWEHRWPSALDLLELSRERCDQTALATMSHCAQATQVLGALGLADAFDFVATRDDVERGKPDPEIYTLVLSELGIRPERALAIEDSPAGVRAAMGAGVAVIAVGTDFTRAALHDAEDIPEDRIVDDPGTLIDAVTRAIEEGR